MGMLGEPVVLRYGRYLLLNPHHLEWTKNFFARHGGKTIFISRFIPVVRHLISIPAGLARMRLIPFIIYTAVGATLWNGFLTYLGVRLKENWRLIQQYTHILDYFVVAGLVGVVVYFVWKAEACTEPGMSMKLRRRCGKDRKPRDLESRDLTLVRPSSTRPGARRDPVTPG